MIEKIIEGIFNLQKIPAKFIAVICSISSVLIFSPQSFIEKLKLEKFNEDYGTYVGIIFLLSGGFLIVSILTLLYNFIGNYFYRKKVKRIIKENICSLTPHEQALIREFYINTRDVLELPAHDSATISLQSKSIIVQISGSGLVKYGDAFFSYKIVDYAKGRITNKTISLPENNDKASIQWVLENRPTWAKRQHRDNIMDSTWW